MSQTILAALRRTLATAPALATLLAIASPEMLAGQTVLYACYVPSSGTVYRIKEPGLPTECGTSKKHGTIVQHVEFSWSPGVNEHGDLTGLRDDDHTQYLLADGVRNSTNGFAVTGTVETGTIPATGPGARLMWYPGKAAFRAGYIGDDSWDDPSIGAYSMALGANAVATSQFSAAFGTTARATAGGAIALGGLASGLTSAALGPGSSATGYLSVSVGFGSVAAGDRSFAIGTDVVADGDYSMALGRRADADGKTGAFVWGDGSAPLGLYLKPVVNNQFVARAAHFWLGTDNNVTASLGSFLETSTGAYLSSGGTWTNSSDVNRKMAFEDVDGDDVLARVAALPVRTWSYKDEDASVRHIGPTAQDFSAAFGLGASDKAIATVDADGVSLAAIQALEKRTAELKRENEALRAELRALAERLESLAARSAAANRR